MNAKNMLLLNEKCKLCASWTAVPRLIGEHAPSEEFVLEFGGQSRAKRIIESVVGPNLHTEPTCYFVA